jgi:cytochrome d ubiquinol oxidase subunit II
MPLELWIAGAVMASLTLYALGGGADFGGGVWDLLARGPRATRQRELIAHAIGPIWEANHVWLILVVVLLFVCFPVAWAAISTSLHVPLTLLLIGIVLRGAAFTFRSYGDEDERGAQRWGRVFAVASVVSPVMLGVCVGAIAGEGLRVGPDGTVRSGFVDPWATPFALVIGLLTLALFAFLAAVYLTHETDDATLRDDFRARALAAGVAAGVLAFAALALARSQAPLVWEGLVHRPWSVPFHLVTGACAVGALAALARRAWGAARVLAVAQVALVLWGWALAQYPLLLPPDLSFAAAAAPRAVLRAVLGALVAGALLLVPSLAYLFRVFKAARA